MAETSEMELGLLQRRARSMGFYCNKHREFDPARGTGDLYLMPAKRFRTERVPTLMSYATAEQIEDELTAIMEDRSRHLSK